MKGTAKLIKKLNGWLGDARLYKLSEHIEENDIKTKYVIVSATHACSGPETYIFPADLEGEILDWGELSGSFRGGLDHESALEGAGFTIE